MIDCLVRTDRGNSKHDGERPCLNRWFGDRDLCVLGDLCVRHLNSSVSFCLEMDLARAWLGPMILNSEKADIFSAPMSGGLDSCLLTPDPFACVRLKRFRKKLGRIIALRAVTKNGDHLAMGTARFGHAQRCAYVRAAARAHKETEFAA